MAIEPTWYERALAVVSPTRAMRRFASRAAFEEMARAYEAAKPGRRTQGWMATGSSANAEIGPALPALRNRARELVRNNAYAAAAVAKLASKIVGTGITPRVLTDDRAAKARLMDDWRRFADDCDVEGILDFGGIQSLAVRCVVESGEALLLHIVEGGKLRLKLCEPDIVDVAKTETLPGGNVVLQGVEFDQSGRRVAYWLFDQHPGDTAPMIRRNYASNRVLADMVSPVFCPLRPGQVHGVPWFAPVALRMRDVDELDEARLIRKKIEGCFAAFIKRPADSLATPATAGAESDEYGRRIEKLSPGRIQYLAQDEDVSFSNPPASEGDTEWLVMQLHAVAAGLGIPYSMLTGDLRQANYSSLRAGTLDFWSLVDQWQRHMIIPMLCRRVWSAHNMMMGRVGDLPPVVWDVPERPFIDPLKDGTAIDQALRAGRRTWRDVVAAAGRDPDEQMAQIADERGEMDALGLSLDFGAGPVTGGDDADDAALAGGETGSE